MPCRGLSGLFFADNRAEAMRAAALCHTCPVEAACGAWADAHRIRFGVWGGRPRGVRRSRREIREAS